jgi:hypothetical protein
MNHPDTCLWTLCLKCAAEIYATRAPNLTYTTTTARLLFGTAAQESSLKWERQRSPLWSGQTGGFSKWQLETGSIIDSCLMLQKNPYLNRRALAFLFDDPHALDCLDWFNKMTFNGLLWALRLNDNDTLGILFARLHYMRIPTPIPASIEDQAHYWKQHYNTPLGAGTTSQYLQNWNDLCIPIIESHNSMGQTPEIV